jgi:probable rRNA maturation factor
MTESDRGGLRVVLVDEIGRPVRVRGLAKWLCGVAPARAQGVVTIALVGDTAMRRLNRAFAGKGKATDVLSFPAWPIEARIAKAARRVDAVRRIPGASAGEPARPPCLGDIAIATGVARRQARVAGHAYAQEIRVLALHGLLHLLGYDHETDQGTMARLEARLRRRGGLTAGIIERAKRA